MSWWDLQRMTTTTTSTSFQQQEYQQHRRISDQQQQQNQEVTEEISILLELLLQETTSERQKFANERNGWNSETPGMYRKRKQTYLSCIIDRSCYYPDCPAPYLSNE
jgi:hypothetical protein